MGINIIYLLTSLDGIFDTGSNSFMAYARLRPRAYDLTLRLRPGVKKSTEGGKEISPVQYKNIFFQNFKFEKCARDYVCIPDYLRAHLYTSENDF